MKYVSFEWRTTVGGSVFYTKAGSHGTSEEAVEAVAAWNVLNSNPRRGYAWCLVEEAPEMKI